MYYNAVLYFLLFSALYYQTPPHTFSIQFVHLENVVELEWVYCNIVATIKARKNEFSS